MEHRATGLWYRILMCIPVLWMTFLPFMSGNLPCSVIKQLAFIPFICDRIVRELSSWYRYNLLQTSFAVFSLAKEVILASKAYLCILQLNKTLASSCDYFRGSLWSIFLSNSKVYMKPNPKLSRFWLPGHNTLFCNFEFYANSMIIIMS